MATIPNRLKQCRKLLLFTQHQMAKEVKVKQKDISRFETGKVKFIPNNYLVYLHNQGINLNWLFTGIGPALTKDISNEAGAQEKNTKPDDSEKMLKLQKENMDLKEQHIIVKTENKVFKQQIKDLKAERKTLMEVFKTLGKGNLFK